MERRCFGYVLIAPMRPGPEALSHAARLADALACACADMARRDIGAATLLHRDHADGEVGAHVVGQTGVAFGSVFDGPPAQTLSPHAFVTRHWGRYVAYNNVDEGQAWLLRDPSGAMAAYYVVIGDVLAVFSHIGDVATILPRADHGIDWRHIASFLRHPRLVTRRTGVCGVKALLPGEVLLIRDGVVSLDFAWRADVLASRPRDCSLEQAGAALADGLDTSTTAMTRRRARLTHQLSGGLDSSVVLSALRISRASEEVSCLTFYDACGKDGDERVFARMAAAANGCALEEIALRSAAYDVTRLCGAVRAPGPALSMLSFADPRFDAVAQALAGRALSSGEGGDHVLLRINPVEMAIDAGIRHGSGPALMRSIADVARVKGWSFWSVLAAVGAQSLFELTRDHASDFIEARGLVSAEAMRALDARDYLHPWLLDHAPLNPAKLIHLWSFIDAYNYHNASRLNWAIDAVTPLLAQPVAEACLAMPAELFCAGGQDRAPMRLAYAGALPGAIRHRSSKGGLTRAYSAALAASVKAVRELLMDGLLARQGLVNRQAMEQALDEDALVRAPVLEEIFSLSIAEGWVRAWHGRGAR